MRILVDATNANAGLGGLVTYAAGLLRGWKQLDYSDEITLIATHELAPEVVAQAQGFCRVITLGHRAPLSRILVQQLGVRWAVGRTQPEALLCLTPVSPVGAMRCPVIAVVHDLRYVHNVREFGIGQLAYRRHLYHRTFHTVDALISVSETTKSHLAAVCAKAPAKTTVIYHGADHVDGWPRVRSNRSYALAFAHWANKRPEFAVRVWSELRRRDKSLSTKLHIVGVTGAARGTLTALIARSSVSEIVELHGYLAEDEFQRLFSGARLLLFPSTLEGFGLPLLEAMKLGVPAVVSRGVGMEEIGGDSVRYARLDVDEFANQCAEALSDSALEGETLAHGRLRASSFSWRSTAMKTRVTISKTIRPASPSTAVRS